MLCQLGACQFTVAPFNMHETDHEAGASFASHEVLGRMPDLEFVGEAAETWTIRGRLFPERFGGLGEMANLHAMRRAGSAQFFMRGDGVPMGWVVIERVTEKSTYIGPNGVGRVIEFEANLKRSGSPNAAGIFNALMDIFR
ncbi:phage tail protein [Tardiphaga sp. 71_E8_N1_1]|jgi:phage protein U|uniref:phage tail protein n=1 Tax=Tardiphaga sp. 71_E8_N1_1 TaxID=3240784 RepID=UPI003F89D370